MSGPFMTATISPMQGRWDQRRMLWDTGRRHYDLSQGSAAGVVHQNSQTSLHNLALPATRRQPFTSRLGPAAPMPVHALRKIDLVVGATPTERRPHSRAIVAQFPRLAGARKPPQWDLMARRSAARAAAHVASQPRLTQGVHLPEITDEQRANADYYKNSGYFQRMLQ